MRSTRALMLALSAAMVAGAAAPAAASGDTISIVIPTNDLNLTSAAGQRALESRINRAARQMCETGYRDVRSQTREAACIADVRSQAEAQLPGNTIALTASRTPRG